MTDWKLKIKYWSLTEGYVISVTQAGPLSSSLRLDDTHDETRPTFLVGLPSGLLKKFGGETISRH